MKIPALRKGGWSELWTGPCVAVREWAGRRTARWLPPALTDRLLDFDRLDTAWPQGRTAIKRVAVRKAAKPG